MEPQRTNLTQLELCALDAPVNLADGHARQSLTQSQQGLIDELPRFFTEANDTPFATVEHRAHEAFFSALGQMRAPIKVGRVRSAYSSSVAIDVVGRCLAAVDAQVGLIHPTFDNIPDLLKSRGLKLIPFEETAISAGVLPEELRPGDCVFVTVPNNPTGHTLSAAQLGDLAQACASLSLTLAIDASFRGFDSRAQYDYYEILDAAGGNYVVIEDSGKLWPMAELKLGFIAFGERCPLALDKALSDVLLSVSPVILGLIERLAIDAASGGLQALHHLIKDNRLAVARAIAQSRSLSWPDSDARVSVARIGLDEPRASALARQLAADGIHVLACGPFHWADRSGGERYLRIALARDTHEVEIAAAALVDRITRYGDDEPRSSPHEQRPRAMSEGAASRLL